jgi:hypothetical protein
MYSTLSFHESAGEEPAKSAVVRRSEHPPLFVTASAAACNQDLFVMEKLTGNLLSLCWVFCNGDCLLFPPEGPGLQLQANLKNYALDLMQVPFLHAYLSSKLLVDYWWREQRIARNRQEPLPSFCFLYRTMFVGYWRRGLCGSDGRCVERLYENCAAP